jgi:hypothetical protein
MQLLASCTLAESLVMTQTQKLQGISASCNCCLATQLILGICRAIAVVAVLVKIAIFDALEGTRVG